MMWKVILFSFVVLVLAFFYLRRYALIFMKKESSVLFFFAFLVAALFMFWMLSDVVCCHSRVYGNCAYKLDFDITKEFAIQVQRYFKDEAKLAALMHVFEEKSFTIILVGKIGAYRHLSKGGNVLVLVEENATRAQTLVSLLQERNNILYAEFSSVGDLLFYLDSVASIV